MDLETKVASINHASAEEAEPAKTPTDTSYLKGKKGIPDFWYRAI